LRRRSDGNLRAASIEACGKHYPVGGHIVDRSEVRRRLNYQHNGIRCSVVVQMRCFGGSLSADAADSHEVKDNDCRHPDRSLGKSPGGWPELSLQSRAL
jgi:hypothetical protein